MYLILFLIFLLIILIYNNSTTNKNKITNKIENYTPKDYSRSIDVRLCKEEGEVDVLIPEYDRSIDLNQIKIIDKKIDDEENYISKQIKINKKDSEQKKIQLTKIKTHIEDPFYHTHNIELMDNFESVKSDYSIINNIKLEDNQAFVPMNYTLLTK